MTVKERIISYLKDHPEGVDDDRLAEALHLSVRQHANSCCRQLEKDGRVKRDRVGGKIHNFWLGDLQPHSAAPPPAAEASPSKRATSAPASEAAKEQHYTIPYGDTGHSYETIFGPYFAGAKSVEVEDPYIRQPHQIQNFVRFCETVIKLSAIKRIDLITSYENDTQKADIEVKLGDLKQSLLETRILFEFDFNPNLHDREIRLDNGWVIKIGRGLDFYQKPLSWYDVGTNDLTLRKCLETKVDAYRKQAFS